MIKLALIIMVFTTYCMLYPHYQKQLRIKRWFREFNLANHQKIFDDIFKHINGFHLSYNARGQQDAFEYVYGEIEFVSFIALLYLVEITENTIFYDLGSGVGKAVIACGMVFNIQKSCGIELFPELHHVAVNQKNYFSSLAHYQEKAKKIYFVHGNILDENIDEATLIFFNATGFFGSTLERINKRLEQAIACEVVITTSKPLSSEAFVVHQVTQISMSWGVVNAYIHQRK